MGRGTWGVRGRGRRGESGRGGEVRSGRGRGRKRQIGLGTRRQGRGILDLRFWICDFGKKSAGDFSFELCTWPLELDRLRRRGTVKFEQRFADGLRDEVADGAFIVEFHLALGRMNVHIDTRGIDFQKQAADRVAAFHQRGVIALHQREVQPAIFHGTAVDEEMLILARRARDAGRADETPEMKRGVRHGRFEIFRISRLGQRGGKLDGEQFLVAALQRAETFAERGELVVGLDGGQLPDGPGIA